MAETAVLSILTPTGIIKVNDKQLQMSLFNNDTTLTGYDTYLLIYIKILFRSTYTYLIHKYFIFITNV